ncbi:hypothetical protein BJ741DRAFT_567708 [Chytriomyces cf. hyalinus JEL632]|nr:hypothetical protein BJ741DRAFT_567708 [Chytriomyces cf. hyalinus JEL632]
MVCEVLRRNAGKRGAIALDIEYNIWQYGEKGRPPATLQLGTFKGHAYVLSLFRKGRPISKLPKEVQELLYDGRHHFVGNYIQADLTRLQKHYHLDSSKVQWLDLAQHAISRGIQLREKGLAFLCRLFLKNHLPKGGVRISNWEGRLSEEQISYGALDTYSSALIFEKMESIENPRYAAPPALESLVAGTKVMLFPKFSGDYLATGHVSSFLGGTWGRYKLSAKAETRVVVKLESVDLSGATVPFPKVPNESLQVYKPGDEILWSHKHIRLETPESVEWYRQKHEFENVLPGPSSFSDLSAANFTTPSDEENFFPAVSDIVETLPVMDYQDDEQMDLDTPANGIHVLQNGEWNLLSEGTEAASMQDVNAADRCIDDENDVTVAINGEKVHVRLDIFHAMQRISRTVLSSHGAYHAFMSRLQDAFFLVCKDDLEQVCNVLKATGKSDMDIRELKNQDWAFFLRHCRKVCPPKAVLLARFQCVVDAFSDMKDAKTGDQLFRSVTRKQIKNLAKHIRNGCISDVPDLSLYFVDGHTKDGLPRYRCCRGTNSNEGFHRHLRNVLHMYSGSPYLLHLVLLEFTYRWNLRMAIKNRGLDPEIGGFYNQHVLEEINFLLEPRVDIVPYAAWGSIFDYEDNGERMGLRRSVADFAAPNQDEFDDLSELDVDDDEIKSPDFNLTKSALQYAQLQEFQTPITAIVTKEEKDRFWELVPRFIVPGCDMEHVYNDFAEEWNRLLENHSNSSVQNLRRKTAAHIRAYHKLVLSAVNARNTMGLQKELNLQIRHQLRIPNHTILPPLAAPRMPRTIAICPVNQPHETMHCTIAIRPANQLHDIRPEFAQGMSSSDSEIPSIVAHMNTENQVLPNIENTRQGMLISAQSLASLAAPQIQFANIRPSFRQQLVRMATSGSGSGTSGGAANPAQFPGTATLGSGSGTSGGAVNFAAQGWGVQQRVSSLTMNRKRMQRPAHCLTCGHLKLVGDYEVNHGGSKSTECTVPVTLRRRTETPGSCKVPRCTLRNKPHVHTCDCEKCAKYMRENSGS